LTDQEALISSFDSVNATSLRHRSSEKWKRYPPEVLPAFIAEMDFPVADSILKAIRAHLEDGADLGYPFVYSYGTPLQCACTKWVRDSFSWAVDPKEVMVFPDTTRVVEVALEQFTSTAAANRYLTSC
jgi:cystathionine beta-lyase